METKDLIKKYWFVGLVGLVLVVFIGMYTADSIKNKPVTVKNKQVDGKYVAYSINGEDVLADDLFETMNNANGDQAAFIAFERAVFDKAIPTTQQMKDDASMNSQTILAYYGEDYVVDILKNMGYTGSTDDLMQYYIDATKQDMLVKEFALANTEEFVVPELGTNGRLIYHILIKVADVETVKDEDGNTVELKANPTEEETAKLNTVLEALKDGMFEQVAYQYTEDTGSKNNGGYIGIVNEENAKNFVSSFSNESLRLADGEVSEPILSEYGWHIIYNAGSTPEAAVNDYYFLQNLEGSNPALMIKAVTVKADELGFEVVSESLKAFIAKQLGE